MVDVYVSYSNEYQLFFNERHTDHTNVKKTCLKRLAQKAFCTWFKMSFSPKIDTFKMQKTAFFDFRP